MSIACRPAAPRAALVPRPGLAAWPRAATGAALLVLAGCTTPPAEYAGALPRQDPKWNSPQCVTMRAAAQNYETGRKQPMSWTTGMLLGPYGLGIAAASKEHQEKQRKRFVRDMHRACSSAPLPKNLQGGD
jgi:hypothetical protein